MVFRNGATAGVVVAVLSLYSFLACFFYSEVYGSELTDGINSLEELNQAAAGQIYNNPVRAIELSREAEKVSREKGDTGAAAMALLTAGLAQLQLGNQGEAQGCLEQSRELFRGLGNRKGEADAENQLGTAFFEQGLYDKAMQRYVQALNIRIEINDRIGMSRTINNMGRVNDKLGNYGKAIELFRQSLALKESEDSIGRVYTLNNMGNSYRSQGELTLAIQTFFEALELADRIRSAQGKAYAMMSLGETYTMTGQLLLAEKYALGALDIYETIQYNHGIAYALFRTGMIYLDMNQPEIAEDYFARTEMLAAKIGQKSLLRDVAWEKARLCEANGDFQQALQYMKKYMELRDEILNSDMQQKMLLLQNQHEIEAKEHEIELLLNSSQAKSAEIYFQRLLLIVFIAFLLVCVIVAGYLYKQNIWRKHKEEELLAVTAKLEQANEQLTHLAATDFLTQLSNRRRFDTAFLAMCLRLEQESGCMAVILIDIDLFKQYNDIYGHQQGDECLIRVAAVLKAVFAGEDHLLARYGGEEFVAVLGLAGEQAVAKAELARIKVAELGLIHSGSGFGRVTCSFGVTDTAGGGQYNPARLLREADQALYQAKNTGRNKVCSYQALAKGDYEPGEDAGVSIL